MFRISNLSTEENKNWQTGKGFFGWICRSKRSVVLVRKMEPPTEFRNYSTTFPLIFRKSTFVLCKNYCVREINVLK
jgi:hypothetical protein